MSDTSLPSRTADTIATTDSSVTSDFASTSADSTQAVDDNGFIEAFNSRLRAECLNAHWFMSLADAQKKLEDWRKYYNQERPHGAIGRQTPAYFETLARKENRDQERRQRLISDAHIRRLLRFAYLAPD